ncbi:hypothetical protein [Fibrella aquatilis]|uniref:Uncharacterized protein n=1 Tax=Fibrella aquatilis TaxID=2817059 RepID=A0A939JZF5_9BACT|nr:hypothetical protein [Fibrella aquatilis]MBO0930130.1 hypothetical protein [Fibrella aquatilis]
MMTIKYISALKHYNSSIVSTMGHERIGHLPNTKRWRNIVNELTEFSPKNNNVASIANKTTKNVVSQLERMNQDKGVLSSFSYLLNLLHASRQGDPYTYLEKNGITLSPSFSLLELARSIKQFNQANCESNEYATIASQALIDTVSIWTRQEQQQTTLFFGGEADPFEPWRRAADAGGFSEISRIYFSNFIGRYLRYFLEREASASFKTLFDRNDFNNRLDKHLNEISKSAFETTKVTEQFAAGWYNKNALKQFPSSNDVKGFVGYAIKKLKNNLVFNLNDED